MKKAGISALLALLLLCCACSREKQDNLAKADAFAEEAEELFDDGQYDEAKAKIDKAIRLAPRTNPINAWRNASKVR